jgi:INO80 complex subunit C
LIRPPKGGARRKAPASDGTATPHIPVCSLDPSSSKLPPDSIGKTLAEQLSYLHSPRPFKNPNYMKNINRRTKNLKNVLAQERERERAERERRRLEKEERENAKMEIDGAEDTKQDDEEEMPTCSFDLSVSLCSEGSHVCCFRYIH